MLDGGLSHCGEISSYSQGVLGGKFRKRRMSALSRSTDSGWMAKSSLADEMNKKIVNAVHSSKYDMHKVQDEQRSVVPQAADT
jgi:hypothetical protein